ncbi:MAG: response regulator [bacterium]
MTNSDINEGKKNLLLIVEDEKILSKTMNEKFSQEGYSVIQAYDGVQGLKLAKQNHPDLILLDLLMPKMDGMSMLKELRNDIWGKKVPVIILTNLSANDEDRLKAVVELEPTYYFEKVDKGLEEIVETIKDRLAYKEQKTDKNSAVQIA